MLLSSMSKFGTRISGAFKLASNLSGVLSEYDSSNLYGLGNALPVSWDVITQIKKLDSFTIGDFNYKHLDENEFDFENYLDEILGTKIKIPTQERCLVNSVDGEFDEVFNVYKDYYYNMKGKPEKLFEVAKFYKRESDVIEMWNEAKEYYKDLF